MITLTRILLPIAVIFIMARLYSIISWPWYQVLTPLWLLIMAWAVWIFWKNDQEYKENPRYKNRYHE